MLTKVVVAAAMLTAAVLTMSPAQAGTTMMSKFDPGSYYTPVARVNCGTARQIVRRAGFRNVQQVRCGGRTYIYSGVSKGSQFQIFLNSMTGQIVQVEPMNGGNDDDYGDNNNGWGNGNNNNNGWGNGNNNNNGWGNGNNNNGGWNNGNSNNTGWNNGNNNNNNSGWGNGNNNSTGNSNAGKGKCPNGGWGDNCWGGSGPSTNSNSAGNGNSNGSGGSWGGYGGTGN